MENRTSLERSSSEVINHPASTNGSGMAGENGLQTRNEGGLDQPPQQHMPTPFTENFPMVDSVLHSDVRGSL